MDSLKTENDEQNKEENTDEEIVADVVEIAPIQIDDDNNVEEEEENSQNNENENKIKLENNNQVEEIVEEIKQEETLKTELTFTSLT